MAESNVGAQDLPDEVLTEILARLPAKSAGRFRCVSRAWSDMLSSDYFVDLHMRRANRPDRPKLLLTAIGSSYDGYLYSWQLGGEVDKLMPDEFGGEVTVPLTKPCRGLILVRVRTDDGDGGYYVFNPSTGAGDDDPNHDISPARAEVFVLDNTSGYWRPSAGNPPLCSVKKKDPAVFLNGYMHFLCVDGGIATFNISDETFGSLLLLPPGFEGVASVLTELDGCLCLCNGEPDSEDPIHVCVLRDYKEARWEKLCCIDRTAWPESERTLLDSLWIAPIGIYDSGCRQKIMFGTGEPRAHGGVTIEDMICSSPTTEAWFDILKWLPTRSVVEMRLVCREWRAISMTDSFIDSHVIHANLKRSPRIKLIVDPRVGTYMDLEEWTDEYCGLSLRNNLVYSQPCHGLNVGSCQFWDFVCNPAISYCKPIEFDDNDGTFFAGRIGLGYNSEICKHVMVHITYKTKNLETRHYELQCKMKYVDDGYEWDPINPPPRPVAGIPPNFVNGKIYWMVDPNIGPVSAGCEVIAFNVETEEFEVLQGPPCTYGSGHMAILELQGTVCISYSDQNRNTVDLWMMKDDGTWLMEYHIVLDKLTEEAAPLAVDPTDGRILLNTGWSLGYYDPRTAAFETIYTMAFPNIKFCPIVCHESLLYPLN
ncbi:hypothetical protein HU200_049571 [Digitaria exilis]|uniref:F-box domain-containing protein n=1 Tax=Digitaria exilis TaxID=1010633 RepID=A0A835AZH7_9POAL|nr:hypothetical protein HU200_049571 [Digitaria exilis]